MAHSKFFKDKLKEKLRRTLRNFSILEIDGDYEATILTYSRILWDFRIQLRQHDIVLFLEIETKRKDPVHNLIKTLIWLNEEFPSNHFIFLHFFDTSYNEIDTPAKDICNRLWSFVNRDCRKNLIYSSHPIDELMQVSQSKRKNSNLSAVCKRISNITERVVSRTIKEIDKKKRVS